MFEDAVMVLETVPAESSSSLLMGKPKTALT